MPVLECFKAELLVFSSHGGGSGSEPPDPALRSDLERSRPFSCELENRVLPPPFFLFSSSPLKCQNRRGILAVCVFPWPFFFPIWVFPQAWSLTEPIPVCSIALLLFLHGSNSSLTLAHNFLPKTFVLSYPFYSIYTSPLYRANGLFFKGRKPTFFFPPLKTCQKHILRWHLQKLASSARSAISFFAEVRWGHPTLLSAARWFFPSSKPGWPFPDSCLGPGSNSGMKVWLV